MYVDGAPSLSGLPGSLLFPVPFCSCVSLGVAPWPLPLLSGPCFLGSVGSEGLPLLCWHVPIPVPDCFSDFLPYGKMRF